MTALGFGCTTLVMKNPTAPDKPKARIRKGDSLGKTPKVHNVMTLTGERVVIIGRDTTEDMHAEDGAWVLASPESNNLPTDTETLASIEAMGKVAVIGKVARITVTDATRHLAYVDDAGQIMDFYLAVVFGRHRVRSIRELAERGIKITMRFEVAGKREALSDLAAEIVIENIRRRVMSPIAMADEIAKLKADGLTIAELASKLGHKNDATVRNWLKLTKLSEPVRALVDSGKLGVTQAYRIGRLPAEQQEATAIAAIENKMSAKQVERTVSEILAAPEPPANPDPAQLPSADADTLDAPSDETLNPEPSDASETPASNDPDPEPPANDPDPEPPADPAGSAETKRKKPRKDEVEHMIGQLGATAGSTHPALQAAVQALRWAQGEMSDDQLIAKIAEMM